MSYTIDDFARGHNITAEENAQAVAQLRRDMQLYELREARRENGLTQAQLAERMGVNQKRVSAIENNGGTHAMVETLRKYMEALGGHLDVIGTLPDGRQVKLG